MEYLVTALKELTTKRWLVYINFEPAFALYISELKRFSIKEDSILSEHDFDEIHKILIKRATIRAMNLLKTKDYATKELINKLKQSYYTDIAIDEAVNYVKKYGYVDDYRYASNYVNFKSQSKSRKQIEAFLKHKGIDDDIINEVCIEVYDNQTDIELNQLLVHMRKKLAKTDTVPDYESRQKVVAYYYRKGFSVDVIRKALDIVVKELCDN